MHLTIFSSCNLNIRQYLRLFGNVHYICTFKICGKYLAVKSHFFEFARLTVWLTLAKVTILDVCEKEEHPCLLCILDTNLSGLQKDGLQTTRVQIVTTRLNCLLQFLQQKLAIKLLFCLNRSQKWLIDIKIMVNNSKQRDRMAMMNAMVS